MTVEKIYSSPEIFKIEVPFENVVTTETNVYVVRDGADVLIVDMGAPTDEAQAVLENALNEIGVDLSSAKVFFTHLHYDHSGLLERMLPLETEIHIGAREFKCADAAFADELCDFVSRRISDEGMPRDKVLFMSELIEIATPINKDGRNIIEMHDGDSIEVGNTVFYAKDLPGHTRGMMGLYDPHSGVFFSGDQLLFIVTPTCAVFLDGTDSLDTYEHSMRRLLGLDIELLLHSHGEIRDDFRQRADIIADSRERRRIEIEKIVEEDPGISGVGIIRSMKWKIPFGDIDECPQRQAWLIYTQGIALLDNLVNQGRLVRRFDDDAGFNRYFLNGK